MTAVARHGDPVGGGTIVATPSGVTVDGLAVARVGDSVTSHGDAPHAAATLVAGSAGFTVGGIPVCRVGDAASCGHTIGGGSPTASDDS